MSMSRFEGLGERELRQIISECEAALRRMGRFVPDPLVSASDLSLYTAIDPERVPDLDGLLNEWQSNMYNDYGSTVFTGLQREQLEHTLDEVERRDGHAAWMDPDPRLYDESCCMRELPEEPASASHEEASRRSRSLAASYRPMPDRPSTEREQGAFAWNPASGLLVDQFREDDGSLVTEVMRGATADFARRVSLEPVQDGDWCWADAAVNGLRWFWLVSTDVDREEVVCLLDSPGRWLEVVAGPPTPDFPLDLDAALDWAEGREPTERLVGIDLDALLERFGDFYDLLYANGEQADGYRSGLGLGGALIEGHATVVEEFNALRGDILSSDREVAAFGMAVADVLSGTSSGQAGRGDDARGVELPELTAIDTRDGSEACR